MLTVKSDCPVQIFRKMMKYLKIYTDSSFTVLVLLFCLDILNKSYTCNKDGRSLKTRLIKSDEMGFFSYTFSLILIYITKYPYSSQILFSSAISSDL